MNDDSTNTTSDAALQGLGAHDPIPAAAPSPAEQVAHAPVPGAEPAPPEMPAAALAAVSALTAISAAVMSATAFGVLETRDPSAVIDVGGAHGVILDGPGMSLAVLNLSDGSVVVVTGPAASAVALWGRVAYDR